MSLLVTKLVPPGLEASRGRSHPSDIDTLDAQCLIARLTDGEIRTPAMWAHERSGALSCAYDGGRAVFTWSADDVAAMARTWRGSQAGRPLRRIQSFRQAHERLVALTNEAGLRPADRIVHNLRHGEVRGVWQDEGILVVVENIEDDA